MSILNSSLMRPIVSVIIPTANRPHYLPRAVESALAGMKPGELEVIVVPNGPDTSWQMSLKPFHNNQAIRIIPGREAHANIARNVGLENARGEFIRFLDDDDYLIPEAAAKQYELISSSGADIVSGSIQLVDGRDQPFDVWHQPDSNDLCAAVLGPGRNCLVSAHVYRRDALGSVRWNPTTNVRQDIDWMLDLCVAREWRWSITRDIVGVWKHHWSQRVSSQTHYHKIRKDTVSMLAKTYDALNNQNRMTNLRKRAVTLELWNLTHSCFFLSPIYWSHVALMARDIDKAARPRQPLYHFALTRHLNPLLLQWIFLPKRWLTYQYRNALKRMQIRHQW